MDEKKCSYNVEILNYFNPELQLKESANKKKLIDSLSELKGSKFIASLVLKFRKIESNDKEYILRCFFELKRRNNYC